MAESPIPPVTQELSGIDLKLLSPEKQEKLLKNARSFIQLMLYYKSAIREVETKLQVLNDEFSMQYQRNPFESIKSRIKTPASILEKLARKGIDVNVENIEKYLHDIAGIRVICSFQQDIYAISEMLLKQDDITLLKTKDYIKNPKPNVYRSRHLLLEIPILLSNEKKPVCVEVQFRTIAMDFWASLEHKLKYKQNVENPEYIASELKICADEIAQLDHRMQELHDLIIHP